MKHMQKTAEAAGDRMRAERNGGLKNVAQKAVVPISAALTSAAVSYAVRKVPKLIEERLLPKLREQGDPRDLAGDVMKRARDLVESHIPLGGSDDGGRSDGAKPPGAPNARRERARTERAARRRQRRTTTR